MSTNNKVNQNKVYFIVVSQGVGTMGYGDEHLMLINSPVLILTTDTLPLKKELVASISFEIEIWKIKTFYLELWSPKGVKISQTDLVPKLRMNTEGNEVGTKVFGIIATDINFTDLYEDEGEYTVRILFNDEDIGNTSFFISVTETENHEEE